MAKTLIIQPEEEFARSYVDRLMLHELSEMEAAVRLGELADRLADSGLNLTAVRSLLASNPRRFTYHERRWIPTARLEAVGRPFNEAVRVLVDRYGAPMPLETIVLELGRIRDAKTDANALADLVRRAVTTDAAFILTGRDEVALSRWAFLAEGESLERAYALHGVSAEEVAAAEAKLSGIDWRSDGAPAQVLQSAAPISAKVAGAVAWKNLNSQDPRSVLIYDGRQFFARLLAVEGYVFGADGVIYPEAQKKSWVGVALTLADKIAPTVDVEDVAPIEVKADDVDKLVAKILASDKSVTGRQMLEEVFEITPAHKTFPDDMANLLSALKKSNKVWWVGGDRFRRPDSAPDFILSVPALFEFPASEARNDEGDLVDVELTDEGLSSSLRKLLSHPLAIDVLDEEPVPPPKAMPTQVRLVLRSIHRELGTFPMCQFPTGWLDTEPKIQEYIFVDSHGRELQVWANHEARLLYNLIDWWYEQAVESGAVFTLVKTDKPNVFSFAWEEQTDPLLYISTQRMEELRELQAESESKSTLSLLIDIMHHWPKGADFLTLLAEMNVVRRTTRRMVASLLSSYQCFYQRSGSPVWHFDNKKVDLGFDKTKKKFLKK